MAYQVIYAGKPLHNYMDIHKINRTILPSRENSSKIIPSRHGSYYTSYKYAEKEISLECKFVGEDREDYMDKLRTVSYLLDVDSPKKLILGDAPDRYLLAVPDGSFEIERVGLIAQFTIIFKCYNPYEYSRTEKNTQRDTMAKVNGVWKANFEEADDADYVTRYLPIAQYRLYTVPGAAESGGGAGGEEDGYIYLTSSMVSENPHKETGVVFSVDDNTHNL